LLHVKGRRRPFVRRVELSWKSLNSGDVFILDIGKPKTHDDEPEQKVDKKYGPAGPPGKVIQSVVVSTLYQWNGSLANRIEKGKALDIVKKLKERERPGAKVFTVEEGQNDPGFWSYLGGPVESIGSPESAGDDLEVEKAFTSYFSLFRVLSDQEVLNSDGKGMIKIEGPLIKENLLLDQVYILDSISEIYVWIGNRSKKDCRTRGGILADQIYSARTVWTAPVSKEYQDTEQLLFKEKFTNWGGSLPISVPPEKTGIGVAPSRDQIPIDIKAMIAGKFIPRPPKEEPIIKDQQANERVFVWKVEGFEKKELEKKSVWKILHR